MDQLTQNIKNDKNTSKQASFNPFPGLRPFGLEESHLFFGREGQSEEVLTKLSQNRFVAVIGASGTGKSSLIYCGLIPILYGGFIAQAGSKWKTVVTRPGSNPVENMAHSIVDAIDKKNDTEYNQEFFAALLRRSTKGIIDSLKYISNDNENILLLVDQFEELFRYRINRSLSDAQNDALILVRLLVEAVNQSELPVYVVLTMRSDFIGECSHFQELTNLINKSNYLIPQMTRDDFRDAITGPVAVGGAEIEPSFVQELLNDVGDNPDQLPILQHAMMRTWNYWEKNTDQSKPLSIADYEAIGKMEKALSEHANEAYDELDEEGKWICEVLFKTITEKGADNRGVRRPTRLESLATIANVKPEAVIKVVDRFRQPGRSFVTPAHGTPLNGDSIIDLSHESLMRIWNRLKAWVDEESMAVQMYMRLSEASALYQEGKTGLWRPPDLQLALNWEKKKRPTLEWAQRHNPAFERVMVFLHTSEKEFEAEELNKIKLQKRALQRTRIFAIVLGTASIISVGLMLWAQAQQVEAEKQKQRATQQSLLAVEQQKKAEKNAKEADDQRKIADKQTIEAQKQKDLAIQQSQIAENQTQIALREQKSAEYQRQLAYRRAEEARREKLAADSARLIAQDQTVKAEKASTDAYNRRMLSISQSMSVKSLQKFDDIDLQALLAYQAFLFNKKYQGIAHNADIYAGLYQAIISKKGIGFSFYKGHNNTVYSIAFNPTNDDFYSTGAEGKVYKWNTADTTHTPTVLYSNNITNRSLDISKDGKILACATNGQGVVLLNLEENPAEVIGKYIQAGKFITNIAFNKENTSLLVTATNTLSRINLADGNIQTIAKADSQIIALAVSKLDDNVAIGTQSGKVMLINLRNSENPQILISEEKNQFGAVCFNNDSKLLAVGDISGFLRIIDMETRKIISSSRLNKATITSIKFSPDDKLIATSLRDYSVLLWDATDLNTQPYKLVDHDAMVMNVSFNRTGTLLGSGSYKGNRLLVRPTQTDELAQILKPTIKRNFTNEEWKVYIGSDIPYEQSIPLKKESKIKVKEAN